MAFRGLGAVLAFIDNLSLLKSFLEQIQGYGVNNCNTAELCDLQ